MFSQQRILTLAMVVLLSLSELGGAATISYAPAVNYPVKLAPRGVVCADFNGDGLMDLAVVSNGNPTANEDGGISILFGNGDGTLQSPRSINAGRNPFALATSDFNRDGRPDLATIDSSGVEVLLGHGDGTFASAIYLQTAALPTAVTVADLDRDGNPDLVVAASSISVLLGNGDGTFQSHVDYPGQVGNIVIVADVNGDTSNDIIASHLSIRTLLGIGDGSFQSAIFSPGPTFSGPLAVADFNHDSKLDVAVGYQNPFNGSSGTVVMLGNGDGTFQSTLSNTFPSLGAVYAADFNGDEKDDLLVVSSGNANVLSGDGAGTFGSPLAFAVGAGPYTVVAADFNQDNAPDLVITNSADATVSVLVNTTGADFSIAVTAPVPGTVSRRQSANSTVTLNHLNTFDNPVALSCSVQSAQGAPTCLVHPDLLTFDANGNATATVTITTGTAIASMVPLFLRNDLGSLQMLWPVAALALVGMGLDSRLSGRRKLKPLLLSGVLVVGLILQAACSGSGSPGSTNYTITVTGKSASTQHSTTTTLTVQ